MNETTKVVVASVLGAMIGAEATVLFYQPPKAKPTEPSPWVARVEALELRAGALERGAEQQLRIRCMNVAAERLDMMIIPVENLGRSKP